MPTADELVSPASIQDLGRVLHRAYPASQWGSVQAAASQLGPLGAERPGPGGSGGDHP